MELQTEYKYIKGTNDMYVIASNGDIYSLYAKGRGVLRKRKTPLKLKPAKNNAGYLYVGYLGTRKKSNLIHRLVAEHFIENPNNYPEVNHIDEDKLNNDVSNLEWCTHEYNMNYGSRNKKTSESQLLTNAVLLMLDWESWIGKMFKKINYNPLDSYDNNGIMKFKTYGVIQTDSNGNEIRTFKDTKEAAKYFRLTIARISQIAKHKNSKKIFLRYTAEKF